MEDAKGGGRAGRNLMEKGGRREAGKEEVRKKEREHSRVREGGIREWETDFSSFSY